MSLRSQGAKVSFAFFRVDRPSITSRQKEEKTENLALQLNGIDII